MRFKHPLQPAVLVRRYKRFLADVRLPDGRIITVHCPNSGSMRGCSTPGMPAMLSRSDNRRRKYPHTLEMVNNGDVWIGINTSLTNRLVKKALLDGVIREIDPVTAIRSEVTVAPGSRLDFMVEQGEQRFFVEVKNCTLAENGWAMFPDAVTARGTRHLGELLALKRKGCGAAVLFCVQRRDIESFSPASHIDSLYARTLTEVFAEGVAVLAYQAAVEPKEIRIVRQLPVVL